MKNSIIKISVILFLSSLFLTACKNDKKAEVAKASAETHTEGEHGDEHEGEGKEVTLTLDQYKAVGVATGKVEIRNLNAVIKANGYTNVPPQNNANVSTLIGGTIQNINILEGTYVAKGKVLATIQNLDVVQMQEDYATANANIEYLQLEYDRQKVLSEENINGKKAFQEVKSKLAVEQVRAKAAQKRLDMLNVGVESSPIIPILAPMSGYIGKIHATKGSYAEVGKSLFEIIDNSQMHLDLNVYEKDLFKIKEGQTVDVVLINQANKTIKATIFGINKTFTNESKSVAVHAKINATDVKGLIAGMYVSANINVNNITVQTLPKDAIVKNGEKFYVFVENGEEEAGEKHEEEGHDHKAGEKHDHEAEAKKPKVITFIPVEVIPGITDLGFTEVNFIGAVPKGKPFVIKGAFYLLSAMMGGGEHEH
jgi:membrane fusion protein, heavy metal efflux system